MRNINHCISVFVGQSPKAIEIKAKVNKWNLIKRIKFGPAKETVNKMKRQLTQQKEIFANHISNKGLISKLYNDPIQLNSIAKKKKQTNF